MDLVRHGSIDMCVQDITDSALYILSEVYRDKAVMARSLVKIFFKLGSVSWEGGGEGVWEGGEVWEGGGGRCKLGSVSWEGGGEGGRVWEGGRRVYRFEAIDIVLSRCLLLSGYLAAALGCVSVHIPWYVGDTSQDCQ